MKERPIIFSGPMVQATLDGRKTVTRRPIKPQPEYKYRPEGGYEWSQRGRRTKAWIQYTGADFIKKCPYGVPGDELWVRETFCHAKPTGYDAREDGGEIWYRATDEGQLDHETRWRPSIHMPRSASRIQLVVKSVRAERLQEITPEDIELEGISVPEISLHEWLDMNMDEQWEVYVKPFRELWDTMYAKKPELQWSANPWVWRVEFERKAP